MLETRWYEQRQSSFEWCYPRHSPGTLLFLIMLSDINKGTTSSKLISFADDTRVYSNITKAGDCDNLQYDLNLIYNWTVQNNMFFLL